MHWLSALLLPLLLLLPRTALKRAVRRGEVRVNGAAAKIDSTLQLGDKVEVVTPMGCARTVTHVNRQQQQQQLPGLDVAFEDDHMAVIIKPQVR